MSFKIITDSCSDLEADFLHENDVEFVPFHVTFDSENYFRDMIDKTKDEFYHTLKTEMVFPKTSMPSIQDFADAFAASLKEGRDILCFTLSHKLSGSNSSAVNAAEMMKEEYPDRNILVVDTLTATAGIGLLVAESIRMRNADMSIEETEAIIQKMIPTAWIHFTVSNLEYLQRGGRIGKAGSLIGSVLNIKPLMHIQEGEIIPFGKCRGLKKAYHEIVKTTVEKIGENSNDYHYCTLYNDAKDDALQLQTMLEKELHTPPHLDHVYVGTTIGAHTGPGAVGVAYVKKYECFLDR